MRKTVEIEYFNTIFFYPNFNTYWVENLFFNPEIDLSFEEIKTDSSATESMKKQAGNYEDFYFNYGLDYDLRNSPYKPSSGSKTFFYQTLPLVSSNNEIVNRFFRVYKEINTIY